MHLKQLLSLLNTSTHVLGDSKCLTDVCSRFSSLWGIDPVFAITSKSSALLLLVSVMGGFFFVTCGHFRVL
jgi:hypothetical protein